MDINDIQNKVNSLVSNVENFSANHASKMQALENKLDNVYTMFNRPTSMYNEKDIYTSNIEDFIRKGNLDNLHVKSLTSAAQEGGEFIFPQFNSNIIANLAQDSVMRNLANVQTISSNALEVLLQKGEVAGGWIKEVAAREETAAAKIERKIIPTHELYAQPKATQRLLEDAEINIEKWLMEQIIATFSNLENASFINGDGSNCPKGILAYDGGKIKHVEATEKLKVTISDLFNLINCLDEQYLKGACFLMHRTTLSTLQNLQDNNGRFIWQPALEKARLDNLFGIPVACCSHMPKIGENAKAVILANFKQGYTIVDRKSATLMRDPYTEKPFVKFYVNKRVGGDVVDFGAIKILTV
jgi:HK97 family phage major capsid protein